MIFPRIHAVVAAVLLSCCWAPEAAAECLSLTSTASSWDAVTICNDFYAGFVNSGARIAEGTSSVKVTSTAVSVSSYEECATNCFNKEHCQWFKVVSNTDGSSKKCTYYQHLALTEATTSTTSTTTVTKFGFIMTGDTDFLNQNVRDSSAITQLGGYYFYQDTDASGDAISMFVGSATAKCAGTPLTLYRAFALNYQSATMLANVASGKTINSMDANFSLAAFVNATKLGTDFAMQVPTDAVDINSTGNVYRTGQSGTTYTYKLDKYGRTTSVSGRMSYTNVLTKPGRLSENTAGTSVRDQYCVPTYQSRFNSIQNLPDATRNGLAFQAGHIFGCQFTNPNGFFNFVPQAANSNTNNGCWYNTELATSMLLKMGCVGDMRAKLTYFDTPGVIDTSSYTGALLNSSTAASIYTTTNTNSSVLFHRPCGYFYRPVKMSLDFTITGTNSTTSRCNLPLNTILSNGGKFFNVSATTATITINRAFGNWMYDSPSFSRLRGMAVADLRANQCYAETGSLAPKMVFTDGFERVFLKVKSNSTASTGAATCISTSTTGVLQIGACSTTSNYHRWTSVVGSSTTSVLTSTASCISVSGASGSCVQPEFRYLNAIITFSGSTANITTADQLVDGYVYVGTKCMVVNGSTLTLETAGCTTLQATYVLDTTAIDDDDA